MDTNEDMLKGNELADAQSNSTCEFGSLFGLYNMEKLLLWEK